MMTSDVSQKCFFGSPRYLANLSVARIEELIKASPSLIVPLSSLEPYGSDSPLGANAILCRSIVAAVSLSTDMLFSPVVEYGASFPYMQFGGVAGLSSSTMSAVVRETLHCWIYQGVKRFFLIDCATDNKGAVDEAVGRTVRRYQGVSITVLRWQELPGLPVIAGSVSASGESWRMDFYVRSMLNALGIDSGPTRASTRRAVSPEVLLTWRKRGKDPSRLRAICPDVAFGAKWGEMPDRPFGTQLFEHIVEAFSSACMSR